MASSALPETLRSVTSTKIAELKKQRDDFEASKRKVIRDAKPHNDDLERTKQLLYGSCRQAGLRVVDEDSSDSEASPASDIARTRRNQQLFLRQAAKDPAFTSDTVLQIHDQLVEDLNLQSIQHEHAQFFSELVTEWLSSSDATKPDASGEDDMEASTFESVGRKEMHEQRAQWESFVFTKSDVNEDEIKDYLFQVFESDKISLDAFKKIRDSTKQFSLTLRETAEFFDSDSLRTTIQGVLKTDLLSDERAAILKSFKNNEDVLQEVADVLNMRFISLDTWNWTTTNGAVPVEQRRQLNGKYRVFMDEDVLDALLLHAIGMKWAVHFRSLMTTFFHSAWRVATSTVVPPTDRQRRRYFLGETSGPANTVSTKRKSQYAQDYFMTQLPIVESEGTRGYDSDDNSVPDRKSPVETKQSLLHLLITEALVARHLHPGRSHAVIRSDFEWFGPSLPHGTIFTVLEFFGVSSKWIEFFRRFLAAPMRFVQDGPDGQYQVRQRGVPMSHCLSDLFGELILFVMDYAVNKPTGSYLYRLHDDFWFWGTEELCRQGWEVMTKFASVMGIRFNKEKTGTVIFEDPLSALASSPSDESDPEDVDMDEPAPAKKIHLPKGDVRWGFLRLDAAAVRFKIDQHMVDEHIKELQRQLSSRKSIFSYIQAYNAYLARFFSNNFGKPSYAFGREHIDDMIDTFTRIQGAIFPPNGSVTDYLANLARARFGVKDIPDGVWYWPVQMGGLELRNPLVSLYCMRESMRKTSQKILAKALTNEETKYAKAREKFILEEKKYGGLLSYPSDLPRHGNKFFSLDEYLRYREERSTDLSVAYDQLLDVPEEFKIHATNDISAWLDKLQPPSRNTRLSSSTGITKSFASMKPYWRWILAVYGAQIVEKYGSVQMVNAAQVPLGVVSVMKSSKVRWQG